MTRPGTPAPWTVCSTHAQFAKNRPEACPDDAMKNNMGMESIVLVREAMRAIRADRFFHPPRLP